MTEYALKLNEVELARYRMMAQAAAQMEADLWAAAGIAEGAVVADVGCGPGAVSLVLAAIVGPTGRVVAVDRDPAALDAARSSAASEGVSNVSFDVGDADDTGIAAGSADVVMIRHVLAHNGGREQAVVDHAATLVRPGGSLYLCDIEMESLRLRPANPDLADLDRRYRTWHEQKGNDLSVGLRLGELLRQAGLADVRHHGRYQIFPVPEGMRPPAWAGREALLSAGLASDDDVARWAAAFERMDTAAVRPTIFVPLFFAFGRRPGA